MTCKFLVTLNKYLNNKYAYSIFIRYNCKLISRKIINYVDNQGGKGIT